MRLKNLKNNNTMKIIPTLVLIKKEHKSNQITKMLKRMLSIQKLINSQLKYIVVNFKKIWTKIIERNQRK